MISLISPAKTLDFELPINYQTTQPRLKKNTYELIEVLKKREVEEVQQLMSLSDKLASLNVTRYQKFRKAHNEKNSKASLFAFKGDVYVGMDAETMDADSVYYAQDHLRILSGLYGLLRPLDLIQPYRLEMGTKLAHGTYKNLYQYWGTTISKLLQRDLKAQGDRTVINLASQEYFKSVDRKTLKADVIDVEFIDFHKGEFKVISFFAKKARGMMARFIVDNKIEKVDSLQDFHTEGYVYEPKKSSEQKLVFTRQKQS